MSDLTGGGPSAFGNGRGGNNGATRPQQSAQGPTGSPSAGGIRGPTVIMRERAEREARKKAEREALEMERVRAEKEQQLLDLDRRRRADKRAAAAGAAGEGGSSGEAYGESGAAPAPQRRSDNSQNSDKDRLVGGNGASARPQDVSIQGRGRGGTAIGGGDTASTRPPRAPSASQNQSRPVRTGGTGTESQAGPSAPPKTSQPPPETSDGSAANAARRATQSSFPHAFERWETLSAHWEGLTSFWIRRLEENSNEVQRDPLSAQLSRQVTDLSAAGANLFHAVVELQRLRASSERKFQRWFFDTRAEQERAQEMTAMLEAALNEERRGRADAIADAVARERERSNSERLVAEMKRELQISREEARRAWEELGRREQEERERTMSLREGHPTLVGGVQVVPMMQGVPSRHTSNAARPQARDEAGALSGQNIGVDTEPAYQSTSRNQRTNDPFVENSGTSRGTTSQQPSSSGASSMPQYTQAPAVQPPTTSATFYQQQHGTTLHPTDQPGSEGTYSDTEYDIDPSGQIRRDSRGNKIKYPDPASDEDTDELDVAADRERELAHLQQYGHAPVSGVEYIPGTSSAAASAATGRPAATYEGGPRPADYSGQGYGSDPWVSFPRHQHPTRLSDVQEEDDERSRTSASQLSRRD